MDISADIVVPLISQLGLSAIFLALYIRENNLRVECENTLLELLDRLISQQSD